MSEAVTIARPYADAAFEVAQKQNALQEWAEMLRSMAQVMRHPEVQVAVNNPRVTSSQLEALLQAFLGQSASEQQKNFMRVLAANRRLAVLPEISALFEARKAEAEKTVNVIVDSAFELTAEQQSRIVAALKKRLARDIKLTCNVKKELLGGAVIRIGDKVIDGSALTRLAEMASALV